MKRIFAQVFCIIWIDNRFVSRRLSSLLIAVATSIRPRGVVRFGVAISIVMLLCAPVRGSDVSAMAQRFIQMQSQSVEAMRSGVARLERACVGPLEQLAPNADQADRDSRRVNQTLSSQQTEAASIIQSTRESLNQYRRNTSLICNNPLNRVLTLFDKNSACAQAETEEQRADMLLRSALQWSQLVKERQNLFTKLITLEHQRLCLTPGFTEKMLDAYDRNMSVMIQGPSGLFRNWLSRVKD